MFAAVPCGNKKRTDLKSKRDQLNKYMEKEGDFFFFFKESVT